MPAYSVLLTDYAWPDVNLERSELAKIDAELIVAENGSLEELAKHASKVDAIMTCWANVPEKLLEQSPKCKIVSRLGIGLDNIDVKAATELNIVVTNVPDYCLIEVAEHTIGCIFALGRKIALYHLQTKQQEYNLKAGLPLRRMQGQTVGLIGLGNIGEVVAQKAKALGFRVLATRRDLSQPSEFAELVPLEQLLAESDYVSLHLPLTANTKHLLGTKQFEMMKSTAFVINTARGGLIDHAALTNALESGEIAGAALDVQDPEPPDLSLPPFNDPRVIVTPHAAFYSTESLEELRRTTLQQVIDCLTGKEPKNIVNE